jgi:antagonist of KipI
MRSLVVERPGLLTTVQDQGRWGLQHLGVPVSGWMDDWSARLANRLVGNVDGEALLEVTWLGPTLRAEGPLSIAITGASFDVTVGGYRTRTPMSCPVADGVTIEFGERHRGARAYLAVAGGIAVRPVLGSRATDIRSGLGGLDGRRLQKADRLPVGDAVPPGLGGLTSVAPPAWLGDEPSLRVMRASETSPDAAERFLRVCDAQYRLAAASDRTGYRLMADRPLPEAESALVSQPVVTGAIQLPPGGSPLLLMADRQTTGGYEIVAVVIAADLPLAGQLGPGDACRFEPCTWEAARDAAAARARSLDDTAEKVR